MPMSGKRRDDQTRLLLKAGRGDVRAFERLHAALHPVVRDFLTSLDGFMDHHQREDMTQEVFVRAWQSAPRFRGDSAAKTFLLVITRNVFREQLRRRRLPVAGGDAVDHSGGVYVSEKDRDLTALDAAELGKAVAEALAKLSDAQREAFVLAHIEGVPTAKAAEQANCTIRQFLDRLYRARKRLRKLLGGVLFRLLL